MPYIRKIELRGFKSFSPKPTVITFDKGFTAITGPNGCGKTNVVDALLFGLGELSARRLRVESLTDLIFRTNLEHGQGKARSAKVIVQFDNSDRHMPIDVPTVAISREIYWDGRCVYRLNGARAPRARVLDVLSIAGISSEMQIVPQGAITRLADVSPEERRRVLEDIIGIRQYDVEKAEAEEKLRAAEASLCTAMGKADEIRKRVEALEKERNDLLRYNYIKDEIKNLEVLKFSDEALQLNEGVAKLKLKVDEVNGRVENLDRIIKELRSKRLDMEKEWRKLGLDVSDKSSKALEVQSKVEELKSNIAALSAKIEAELANLDNLEKIKNTCLQRLEISRGEAMKNYDEVQMLDKEYETLLKQIDEKRVQYNTLIEEISNFWNNLNKGNEEVLKIEEKLSGLERELVKLERRQVIAQVIFKVLMRKLNKLISRKQRLMNALNDLNKSLKGLEEVREERIKRLNDLQQAVERDLIRKEKAEAWVDEAEKALKSAERVEAELSAKLELAKATALEERQLKELVQFEAIRGSYGRLRDLIKVKEGYERIVEAAATGWLDAIVVRDLESALECAKAFKSANVNRAKIIPAQGVNARSLKIPPSLTKGVKPIAAFVECAREHKPIVEFAFRGAVLAPNERTAFALSREGCRAITIDGDLYEAGGGLEVGREQPVDALTVPSEGVVKGLSDLAKAFKERLAKKKERIEALESEVVKARLEIARLSESVKTLDAEVRRARKGLKLSNLSLEKLDAKAKGIQASLERRKAEADLLRERCKSVRKESKELRQKLAELRRIAEPSMVKEMEIRREELANELIDLERKLSDVKSRALTLRKNDSLLRNKCEDLKSQLDEVEKRLTLLRDEVECSLREREALRSELLKLERAREELADLTLRANERSKELALIIDGIDEKLNEVEVERDKESRFLTQLQMDLQATYLRLQRCYDRLKELGFERPQPISLERLQEVDESLKELKAELERIGAVNQLAPSQYDEEIARYKELSLRLNELERERQAILSFMEEVERKKRDAFLRAFEIVNERLNDYFNKLTDGGTASLRLESPEDPFSGGVDIVVRFPGKPSIVVSGASGGERSVAAISFMLALRELTPAAFYVFDEVDAHLDAFYVGRLGDILVEESKRAQFIVITLKPEIVNKAEKVYGVYSKDGVSHVVSLPLKVT